MIDVGRLVHDSLGGVLNSIGIAIIVALFGLYVNRALERYKARSVFLAGYTTKHISAISEAWTKMYGWEDFVRQSFRFQRSHTDEQWHLLMDDLSGAIDESRQRELDIRRFVEGNRFWLGEQIYGMLVMYHNELDTYVRTAIYGSYPELQRLRTRLTNRKQDIMSVLHISRGALY